MIEESLYWCEGKTFKYKWMDDVATEWAKEDCRLEDLEFIRRVNEIFNDN